MNETSMSSLEKLKKLVSRFDDHRDAYLSGQYNETQVRREFIDPFFKLLGWDIDNEIDRLVYDLYDLTKEEIALVEKANG